MLAGLIQACTRAPEARPIEVECLAPKALARRNGAIVPIYDQENPPILAVTSSVGLTGRWEGGSSLAITRGERRGGRILVWAKLPEGRPTWVDIGGERTAVEIWPVLSTLPEIVALPKQADARRAAIATLLDDDKTDLKVALAARMELARSFQRENDGPRARAAWIELAEAAERADIPSLITHGLRSAAYVAYFAERDFATVEPLLERAEVIDRASGFLAGSVRTALLRAAVAHERGRLREATAGYEDGARQAQLSGLDRDAGLHVKALAPLLQDQGLHHRALEVLEQVEPTFARSSDPRDRVWFLNDLTWVLVRGAAARAIKVDPERIRRAALEGIELASQLGASEEVAQIRSHLAWLELLEGRRVEAREEITKAQAAHGVSSGFASRFLMLLEARLDLEEGLAEEADRIAVRLEKAARDEAEGRASDLVWRALEVRALAHAHLGRHREATEFYRQALVALEEVSGGVGLLEARGPYFADRRSLLENANRHSIARGAIADAFEASDRYVSAVYRALERSANQETLDPATQIEVRAMRGLYDRQRAREAELMFEREVASARRLGEISAALKEARAELLKIGSELSRKERLPPLPGATVQALKQKLEPDEAVLTLFGEGTPRIHLLDRRGVRLLSPDLRAPLPLARDVRHLYVVGADVGTTRFVVDARDISGARLIEHRTISYLPYAGALLAVRSVPPLERPALVVADPEGDLPWARAEGQLVATRIANPALLMGKDATRARVLAALSGQRLFHFAGHGALDSPWHAHLRLADDRLDALDILVERPQVGVVVLSGCKTGVGQSLGPTQTIALPEIWWIAGARAVLASDRTVGDDEARRFTEAFYAHGGAERPVTAYQAAARSLIDRGDDSWQPFRVVGLR